MTETKPEEYVDVPLLHGEVPVREQPATIDGRSIWRARLLLTDQRLLVHPLSAEGAVKLRGDGIESGSDQWAMLGRVPRTGEQPLTTEGATPGPGTGQAIKSVVAGRNADFFRPATLVLSLGDDTRVELGILKSGGHADVDPANNAARDEWVALVGQRLVISGEG